MFRHNLQRELAQAHAQHRALTDAQLEAIIPVNTHHDPASHVEVHIDHSVPHLQIHFDPEPGTEQLGAKPRGHTHSEHTASEHSGGGHLDTPHALSSQSVTPVKSQTPVVTSRVHTGRKGAPPQPMEQSGDQERDLQETTAGQCEEDALADAILESIEGAESECDTPPLVTPTEISNEGEGDATEQLLGSEQAVPTDKARSVSAAPIADPFTTTQVQTVAHLDPPVMPKGYPSTIEQMIRIPPVRPEGSLDPLPIVTQQLHIGTYRRINGPVLRKQQAVERRLAQEREEARLRALWLATPKRKRNLKGIRLFRRCNYMVLLSGYFDPLRPNTITLKGLVASEATRMSMYLGLGRIRDMLKLDTHPQSWSSDELSEYVGRVMRFAGIIKTDSGAGYAISILGATGPETALRYAHTVEEFLVTLRARQRRTRSAQMHNPDSLSAYYVGYLEEGSNSGEVAHSVLADDAPVDNSTRPHTASSAEGTNSRPFTADTSSTAGPPVTSPFMSLDELLRSTEPAQALGSTGSNRQLGWTSLGGNGSSRRVGAGLGSVLRPVREIGRHRRMSSRAVRVQHVHCIYALYANTASMTGYRSKTIPVWPTARGPAPDQLEPNLDDERSVAAESSDDDDDFLKARASDSDEEGSDEENAIALLAKGGKRKKGAKRRGKGDFNDEDDGDSSLVDRQNDTYAAMTEGLVLELVIYVPHAAHFQELPIPTGNYRIAFTVDELDPMFPTPAEKERVAGAVRAVYRCFFDTATGPEVRQAEADWDWLGTALMKRARWAVRGGLPERVVTAVSDLQLSELNIDILQEMFSAEERQWYIQTLLYASAEAVVAASAPERPLFSEGASMRLLQPVSVKMPVAGGETRAALPAAVGGPPHVALTWSRVTWSKAMKVRCANKEDRGESVRLQVMAFQRGAGLGVVCFDRERHEVYFAEHPDPALLLSQIRGMRFLSPSERSLQLFFFLATALVYAEVLCEDGVKRGKVAFGADEEGAVLDSAEVVEDDYAAATESLLNTAASKAQARMKRRA